ncbi:hypothetical protein JST97_38070 [bacterium]|nr:hypothetical protein [bacterium]
MQFDNLFDKQLRELSEEQAWVLQVLGQHRSALLSTLEGTLERARSGFVASSLESLLRLGLVECRDEVWRLTWTGTGVANWREQKVWLKLLPAGMRLTEPRDGENGSEIGPSCDLYRQTLFAHGRCWCGRSRREHLASPEAAQSDVANGIGDRAVGEGGV